MGMFDTIRTWDGREFQTKDLDCELDTYLVSGGRLLKLDGKGGFVDSMYHGTLHMYDYPNEVKGPFGNSVSMGEQETFILTMRHGQIMKMQNQKFEHDDD